MAEPSRKARPEHLIHNRRIFINANGALDLGRFSIDLATLTNDGDVYFNRTGGTALQISGYYQGSYDNHGGTPQRYSPSALIDQSYTARLQSFNQLPSLRQRTGNYYLVSDTNLTTFWARTETGYHHQQTDVTTARLNQNISTYKLKAGIDCQFYEDDTGAITASFSGQCARYRQRSAIAMATVKSISGIRH